MRLHALFLLVAVLAFACASVPPPSPTPRPAKAGPDRPRHPVFGKRDLHIHLRHVEHPEKPHLEVTLTFRGDPSGKTNLRLPTTWGGHDELWRGLENVRVDPPARDQPQQGPSLRTFLHEPDALLRVHYVVHSAVLEAEEARQPYRPIVSADHVHLIGETFLATPEWDDDAFVNVRLSWDLPSSWSVAHSFGVGTEPSLFQARLGQVTHAIYVAGDFRVLRTEVRERPVYVALRGAWAFTDDELLSLVGRVVDAERSFFGDDEFPHFLVTMIPTGSGGCCSYGGTGLTNAFATFIETDRGIDERMKHLLTHELFHTWNGRRIGRMEPEQLVYWFSEGFTDYYARLLQLRASLIDLPEYVRSYNQTLRQYALSPVRTEPNRTILERFWEDPAVERLPYQRGDVLAHRWNERLRALGRSLDDVMLDLFHEARDNGTVVAPEVIARLYERYDSRGIALDLERHVERGEWIEPSPSALGPCVSLEHVKMGPLDFGFDLETTEQTGKVTDVNKTGPAFRAGLRDGMQVRRTRTSSDPTRECEVHVGPRGGDVKVFRYLPQGEPRAVPQYRLDEARYERDREACLTVFR